MIIYLQFIICVFIKLKLIIYLRILHNNDCLKHIIIYIISIQYSEYSSLYCSAYLTLIMPVYLQSKIKTIFVNVYRHLIRLFFIKGKICVITDKVFHLLLTLEIDSSGSTFIYIWRVTITFDSGHH